MMGLPSNLPTVILNGPDPGVLSSDQAEATLDVEWAGAGAKKAPVKVVVSKSTAASDGVTVSAQYIVNHKVAPVMTTSYSACEAAAGYAYAQFWGSLWQQAAAEGITSLIASGDSARRVAIRLPRRSPTMARAGTCFALRLSTPAWEEPSSKTPQIRACIGPRRRVRLLLARRSAIFPKWSGTKAEP